jgi:hypothetical protein
MKIRIFTKITDEDADIKHSYSPLHRIYFLGLNLRNVENTSIPAEPINTGQTKLIGRNDRIRANEIKGISTATNLYLSSILIAWIARWELVRPITTRGLRLKTSKNRCLTFLGMDA